jgi:hypothetical protein
MITARSSLSAAIETRGGPSSIPLQTGPSTIHAGSSRDTVPLVSKWTTAALPCAVRRSRRSFLPYRGCQRYSTTTKPNRYAESRLIPVAVGKQEQVPAERLTKKAVAHKPVQALEALAHIGCAGCQVDSRRRSCAKHSEPLQQPQHALESARIEAATDLDSPVARYLQAKPARAVFPGTGRTEFHFEQAARAGLRTRPLSRAISIQRVQRKAVLAAELPAA